MALNLPYYTAMLRATDTTPYDYYANFEQSLINARWDNTTTLYTVQEESPIGSFNFVDIEVRLNHMIAEVSSGLKNGDDFRAINFKNLQHEIIRGLYYKIIDNGVLNYYIATFTDERNLLTKNVVIRRCNNWMKWKDLSTGIIYQYPCILAYDDTSPQNQKVKDIITPNNGVVVIVQGNNITANIYLNQRFIFNGRPFKIAGYNNYMQDYVGDTQPNLYYFDTYLDEISPYDDLINGIADNSQPNTNIGSEIKNQPVPPIGEASIVISPILESLTQGQTQIITAYVQDSTGNRTADIVTCTPSGAKIGNYVLVSEGNNQFSLTNVKYCANPLILNFTSNSLVNSLSVNLKGLF